MTRRVVPACQNTDVMIRTIDTASVRNFTVSSHNVVTNLPLLKAAGHQVADDLRDVADYGVVTLVLQSPQFGLG